MSEAKTVAIIGAGPVGLAAAARLAADQLMLAAVAISREIRKSAVGGRDARIVFLDAAAHLLDQPLLQGTGMTEQTLGVSVLRL